MKLTHVPVEGRLRSGLHHFHLYDSGEGQQYPERTKILAQGCFLELACQRRAFSSSQVPVLEAGVLGVGTHHSDPSQELYLSEGPGLMESKLGLGQAA